MKTRKELEDSIKLLEERLKKLETPEVKKTEIRIIGFQQVLSKNENPKTKWEGYYPI
jgi:hypothetical protein